MFNSTRRAAVMKVNVGTFFLSRAASLAPPDRSDRLNRGTDSF